MKEYMYNNVTVNVPQGWHEITVATYDRVWTIKPTSVREKASIIATACGVDLQTLLEWPTDVFNMILADTQFMFENHKVAPTTVVKIDGADYVVAVEEKLSFGEYIDVDDVQKNSDAILTNVLAIVCRPPGEKYDPDNNDARAKMFGALPMSEVQGVLGFFLQSYQVSTRNMRLLNNLRQMADLLPRNIGGLLKHGDSIKWWRIWPIIKYIFLMKLLRARLQRFSHS